MRKTTQAADARRYDRQTAIIANGDFPKGPLPLGILRNVDHVVCCDGAAKKFVEAFHRLPDAVVGDGDSLDAAMRRRLGARFHRVREQQTNDLEKAFRFCLARHAEFVVVLGATGRREDHTLGNIFRLLDFARRLPSGVVMATETGLFWPVRGTRTFDSACGMAVSVFAPHSGTRVKSTGLQWPLAGVKLEDLWTGTLNRAIAKSWSITASKPVLVFVSVLDGKRRG